MKASIAPGEVLSVEFLKPLGFSQNALARGIQVPPARVNDIVHGRRAITADTAVRLSLFLGTSIEFWINLQGQYDARIARERLQPRLRRQIRPFAAGGCAAAPCWDSAARECDICRNIAEMSAE